MSQRSFLLVIFAVLLGCKPSPGPQQARGPELTATVVTLRTTVQPGGLTTTHSVVVAGDQVRSTDERDQWRLFDVKGTTVTFVDDIAKTIRTEELGEVTRKRRQAMSGPLAPHFPYPRVRRTGEKRTIAGVPAEQLVIESGTYRRELWMAEHPSIPANVFSMMHLSEAPSTPLLPMMRHVDEALTAVPGFPLLDRAEVAFGNEKMVVERVVTGIGQQTVAANVIRTPSDYLDLTEKPQPAGRR